MVFQPVVNAAEAAIHGLLHGKPVTNVLNFAFTTEPTESDLQTLATTVDTWMGTTWLPDVSAEYEYLGTSAKSLISATAPYATAALGAGVGGRVETTPVSNQVSFAIRFTSALTGRSNRGRFYVAGLTDGDFSSPNYVDISRVSAWVTNLGTLQAACLAVDFTLSIVSRVQGGVRLDFGELIPVTAIGFSDLRVDTMRRRLPKS